MMKYRVKKIDMSKLETVEDYNNAIEKATIEICNGLKEVETYCGGKLKRERCGYSGRIGNIEYIAMKL